MGKRCHNPIPWVARQQTWHVRVGFFLRVFASLCNRGVVHLARCQAYKHESHAGRLDSNHHIYFSHGFCLLSHALCHVLQPWNLHSRPGWPFRRLLSRQVSCSCRAQTYWDHVLHCRHSQSLISADYIIKTKTYVFQRRRQSTHTSISYHIRIKELNCYTSHIMWGKMHELIIFLLLCIVPFPFVWLLCLFIVPLLFILPFVWSLYTTWRVLT